MKPLPPIRYKKRDLSPLATAVLMKMQEISPGAKKVLKNSFIKQTYEIESVNYHTNFLDVNKTIEYKNAKEAIRNQRASNMMKLMGLGMKG